MNIRTKLFLAIFFASLLTIVGLGMSTHWQFKHRFLDYLHAQQERSLQDLAGRLAGYYVEHQSWDDLRRRARHSGDQPNRWLKDWLGDQHAAELGHREARPKISGKPAWRAHPPKRGKFRPHPTPFLGRLVLLDASREIVAGGRKRPDQLWPIVVNEQPVGFIGLHRNNKLTKNIDLAFVQRFNRQLWVAAVGALLAAGLIAWLMARHFGRPITALREGSARLAAGEFDTRVSPTTRDELGALTRDFNYLAERIEEYEQARTRWVADTAHELRTPLSVLRGEVEAMQDGVRSADKKALASLHQEVRHLERLTEDLYQLSVTGESRRSYQMARVDALSELGAALSRQRVWFEQDGIELEAVFSGEAFVRGDLDRLAQLFDNLLQNSRRYTEPPGTLWVRAEVDAGMLHIHFEDSPPGVSEGALPRLFDRFYRAEGSRNRRTGGAGLGLSICQNIVSAHDGEISAYGSPLGGLGIHLVLPLEGQP